MTNLGQSIAISIIDNLYPLKDLMLSNSMDTLSISIVPFWWPLLQ